VKREAGVLVYINVNPASALVSPSVISWFLSAEPWLEYRTRIDLLDQPEPEPDVQIARNKMLGHPQIKVLIEEVKNWPGDVLKRHNDAKHPIHKLSFLAELGLKKSDHGMKETCARIFENQTSEGVFDLWNARKEKKPYLFAMGTDFQKLKAPFIWYDILHVLDILSNCPSAHDHQVTKELSGILIKKQDESGKFTPESVYRAWNEWDFDQKKEPSAWISFLVYRILKRFEEI
jgi:hypothetical protein